MAAPWEKYQQDGPWKKYAKAPQSDVVQEGVYSGFSRQGLEDRAARRDQVLSEVNSDAATAQRAGMPVGLAMKAVQGLPFVGEWVDEGLERIAPEDAAEMRRIQSGMDEVAPKASLAAEIGGGVAGSLPFVRAGVGAVQAAKTGIGAIGRGLGLGAAAGAAEGAIAGAGRANDGDRTQGAVRGGVIGGGLGAALGALAPAVAGGAKALGERVKNLDVNTIATEFGLSKPAARVVKNAIMNDDLSTARDALSRLGDDAMLADAGAATGALLDASSKTGGSALRVTREAVEGRATAAGQRMQSALDNILGEAKGVRAVAGDIARETSPARKAAYDRAYATPIDYSGPGRQIEEVLSRVPARTLRAAIDEANEAMTARGARNMQILADIAEDGSVTFREMPNVEQIDQIKRALDDIGRESVDQFGRATAQGNRARGLARELRDATASAVPAYRRALRLGGDKIAQDNALDVGRTLFRSNTSLEDVRDVMKGATDDVRAAARQGVRETIEDTLSNVRRTITDPNTDAREAMKLVTELSSRKNKAKLRFVLGDDADRLLDELQRTEAALALRGVVARNSDTAIRQAIQGQVRDEASPGVLRRILGRGGNPLDAARELTETIAGIDPRSLGDAEKALFDEIAEALTRIRGPQAQQALDAVQRALDGQPLRDQQAQQIARTISDATLATSYQAGNQSLEPR